MIKIYLFTLTATLLNIALVTGQDLSLRGKVFEREQFTESYIQGAHQARINVKIISKLHMSTNGFIDESSNSVIRDYTARICGQIRS